MIDLVHILALPLAVFRLTELVTMDRISEPFRKRFPHYLWGCPRCVSVWAGIVCTIAFSGFPYANWPLAIAFLYLVEWDWTAKHRATIRNRVQTEVERLAIQEYERQRREHARAGNGR